jgi:Putative MetA-pathway of phenol degradation
MRGIAIGFLALASAAGAAAATDSIGPICTDRPGKSSSTCTVPKGMWQVESSFADWSLTKVAGSRATSLSLGSTALKYGISDDTHVEVAMTPFVRNRERFDEGRTSDSGVGDVTVKVKHRLTVADAAFSAAIVPFVKLPTASKRIGNGKVDAGLVVPLSWSIGDTPLSLSSSPELDLIADGDGDGYHLAGAGTLSLGIAATDRLSLAAELWTGWDWDEATTRQSSIGTNAAYRITDNLQIDGQVDFGLTRESADVEIAGGVSVRF